MSTPGTPTESGYAYERTVNITPNAAIASFGVENWSDNSNAIGNWITISQSLSNPSAWNIRVLPNETGKPTETHFVYPASLKTNARLIAFRNFIFSKVGEWKF